MSKIRPLEKEIEAELIRRVQEELGGVSLKTHIRHWPDRVSFLPGGRCFFAELKRPKDGKFSKGQEEALKELRTLGHRVHNVWSLEDVDNLIGIYKGSICPLCGSFMVREINTSDQGPICLCLDCEYRFTPPIRDIKIAWRLEL